MNSDVLFIYRLILRKSVTLGKLQLLVPLQSVAFLRPLVAFTGHLDLRVYVSWYQSIDIVCIAVSVKFEDGLSISVLRNKSLFSKNWGLHCSNAACRKRTDHPLEKSFTFLESHFSPEWDRQPTIKFNMNSDVPFIFRLIPVKPGFLGWIVVFDTTPISRFFKASYSVNGLVEHQSACFLVSMDRYSLHCVACEI
jgi:hypothetical protein